MIPETLELFAFIDNHFADVLCEYRKSHVASKLYMSHCQDMSVLFKIAFVYGMMETTVIMHGISPGTILDVN